MSEGNPRVIDESALVLDDALKMMSLVQSLDTDSLAVKDLRAAVTIARMARTRVSRLVADARDEHASWAEIGRALGTRRLWALLRHGLLTRRKRTPLALD